MFLFLHILQYCNWHFHRLSIKASNASCSQPNMYYMQPCILTVRYVVSKIYEKCWCLCLKPNITYSCDTPCCIGEILELGGSDMQLAWVQLNWWVLYPFYRFDYDFNYHVQLWNNKSMIFAPSWYATTWCVSTSFLTIWCSNVSLRLSVSTHDGAALAVL